MIASSAENKHDVYFSKWNNGFEIESRWINSTIKVLESCNGLFVLLEQ